MGVPVYQIRVSDFYSFDQELPDNKHQLSIYEVSVAYFRSVEGLVACLLTYFACIGARSDTCDRPPTTASLPVNIWMTDLKLDWSTCTILMIFTVAGIGSLPLVDMEKMFRMETNFASKRTARPKEFDKQKPVLVICFLGHLQ
jgi:hypothetical protein